MIVRNGNSWVEAEIGEHPIYIGYGEGVYDPEHCTSERLGHFLAGRPYPETEEELRIELERFVGLRN